MCSDAAVTEWVDAGRQATMLLTASLSREELDAEYLNDMRQLLEGATPCELAMILMWMTRTASSALVDSSGSAAVALEGVQERALELAMATCAQTDDDELSAR